MTEQTRYNEWRRQIGRYSMTDTTKTVQFLAKTYFWNKVKNTFASGRKTTENKSRAKVEDYQAIFTTLAVYPWLNTA